MTFSKYILRLFFLLALAAVAALAEVSLGMAQNSGQWASTSPSDSSEMGNLPSSQEPQDELIFVQLEVERQLVFDIDARLYENQLYLPASQFFSLLQIKTNQGGDRELTVHYPDPDHSQKLPFDRWEENRDYLRDEYDIYIRADHLEQLFEMQLMFDYRRLSINLYSDNTLPVIANTQRKERYRNFVPRSVEFTPDVRLPGGHHLLNGWVADWSLNNSLDPISSDYSYNLGLGGQLLGGNFSAYGSGSKNYGLHTDRLRGRWELPVYSTPMLKQLRVGFLSHRNATGLENRSYRGLSLTNRPHAPRQYFNVSDYVGHLEPGWDTELYVNHRLTDFAVGSRQQDFRFSTPLQYGTNQIQLNYYDPNGIVHRKEHLIYIPHEFLPPGEFQYTLSGGRYDHAAGVDFGRLDMQLGVSPNLTVGGGTLAEWSEGQKKLYPFVQSWLRLGNSLIAEGSHTYGRLTEGALRFKFSGSRSLLMNVKKYHRNPLFGSSSDGNGSPLPDDNVNGSSGMGSGSGAQGSSAGYQDFGFNDAFRHFNKTGKSLEASLNTSFPVDYSFLDLSMFLSSRFTQNFSGNQNLNLYSGFSTRLPFGLNARINNRMVFRDEGVRQIRPAQMDTEVQLSRRMFRKLLLRPRLTFNHRLEQITGLGMQMNVRLTSRSYLNFSFDRDNLIGNNRFLVSFKLDLPFARHTSYMRSGTGRSALHQSTTGSVAFNGSRGALHFDDKKQMEKAGLVLDPFLDLNDNGTKDKGEPAVDGVSADVYRPGRDTPSYRGENIIENLVPYEEYFIRVDDLGVDNPLWKARHSSYSVQVLPNMFNRVPIPIIVTGEVAGKVEMVDRAGGSNALYGLEVQVTAVDHEQDSPADEKRDAGSASAAMDRAGALHTSGRPYTTTLSTYSGGHFYYVGLMPGRYRAVLNAEQLAERSLTAVRDSLEFTIETARQGDIVEDLAFQVAALNSDDLSTSGQSSAGAPSATQPPAGQSSAVPSSVLQQPAEQSPAGQLSSEHASAIQSPAGRSSEMLSPSDPSSPATYFAIQMGAFSTRKNALSFSRNPEFQSYQEVTVIYDPRDSLHKVLIGTFSVSETAWQTLVQLVSEKPHIYRYSFIVELPEESKNSL